MAYKKLDIAISALITETQVSTVEKLLTFLKEKKDVDYIEGYFEEYISHLKGTNIRDKLYFYSKSASVPPGKGTNEHVHELDIYIYKNLPLDFRRVLSNFHVAPFKFHGYTYNTIEHVFQGKKVELVDVKAAHRFTVESGDPIGLGDGAMAQKNRKLVMLSPEDLKKWDAIKWDIMKEAAREKYIQNPEAAKILLNTRDAELWHIVSRQKPVRFKHLEDIRLELSRNATPS
jgi:ribA/ribD-fused uncharacterized protein